MALDKHLQLSICINLKQAYPSCCFSGHCSFLGLHQIVQMIATRAFDFQLLAPGVLAQQLMALFTTEFSHSLCPLFFTPPLRSRVVFPCKKILHFLCHKQPAHSYSSVKTPTDKSVKPLIRGFPIYQGN